MRLTIVDVTGRHVRTLLDGHEGAGSRDVVWDGRDGTGREVSSGVYFYSLDAGDTVFRRRVVVLE